MRSAYMIAFRDTDFLDTAIRSIIDDVDELVFVDGAYAWMAPHLRRIGLEAERSGEPTDQILAQFGDKVRYFSGIWDDELHKRAFGFDQCRGDLIIRIDADEHMEIDEDALEDFLASPATVGPVEFPLMATGELHWLGTKATNTPWQMMFFKRSAFGEPLKHCSYLWLVLSDEERSRLPATEHGATFRGPVARNMHLSSLRTPLGSVGRARFYILRWILDSRKVPWGHALTEEALDREDLVEAALEFFDAGEFESWLLGTEIVSGIGGNATSALALAGLSQAQRQLGDEAYENCAQARRELTDLSAHPRLIIEGMPCRIDITGAAAPGSTRLVLKSLEAALSGSAELRYLRLEQGGQSESVKLPVAVEGTSITCDLTGLVWTGTSRVELGVTLRGLPGKKTQLVALQAEYP